MTTSRAAHPSARHPLAHRLPSFPWDMLQEAKARAAAHPEGIVDLSVGTPVDPTPESVRAALADAANWPGYPTTIGTEQLREAIIAFAQRHRGAGDLGPEHVLPTIGSKELVAHLPFQLGIGPDEIVAHPHIAYPTYDMGARLTGASPLPVDLADLARRGDAAITDIGADPAAIRLLWVNSPSNPTGEVLSREQMRQLLTWARGHGIIVASDECYALLPWSVSEVPSVLDPQVNDGDLRGVLCAYSLSKQSNLAGYRAAFVAGDPELIAELVAVRKQAGMMLPGPMQAAMTVALGDDAAARAQHEVYRARREVLLPALRNAGGTVHGSQAGLYLWTSFGTDAMSTVSTLAEHGILVAPGMFYGVGGENSVRVALTASDERIAAAAERLRKL